MKKLFLFAATAIVTVLIIVSSCRKGTAVQLSNWICHCALTNSTGTYNVDVPENGKTEGDASTACAKVQDSYISATTTPYCQLQQAP